MRKKAAKEETSCVRVGKNLIIGIVSLIPMMDEAQKERPASGTEGVIFAFAPRMVR